MTINQIVDEQMKEFNERYGFLFIQSTSYNEALSKAINDSIHSYTRKIVESVAEEIIPMNFEYCDSCQALGVENFGGWCSICKDALNANRRYNRQRLKVKEIISQIGK